MYILILKTYKKKALTVATFFILYYTTQIISKPKCPTDIQVHNIHHRERNLHIFILYLTNVNVEIRRNYKPNHIIVNILLKNKTYEIQGKMCANIISFFHIIMI